MRPTCYVDVGPISYVDAEAWSVDLGRDCPHSPRSTFREYKTERVCIRKEHSTFQKYKQSGGEQFRVRRA